MLPVIEKLLILQDRDRRLLRLRAELAHLPHQRQLIAGRAAKALADADVAKKTLQQAESDRKKLELEVDTIKDRIGKLRTQQNDTRSNDQYKAFQHQVETCEKEVSRLEDLQLDLMEKIESAGKISAEVAKASAATKAETDKQLKDLTVREENLKSEADKIGEDREGIADEIDETTLGKYERVLKTRGDNAVVGVAKGICGGCHVRLPHQSFISAKAQSEVVTCTNCGRLLYFTSDMEYVHDDESRRSS
ncbi:MAG TPA: C4-type zinc ribbon domain-containing protein [Candidatus Limnocylindria bacterium]|jgi:predicted  nucleic acid-binding Zn-ribbon protein|nr:C4-type zinc ribbon domain-containing protein [Candidatus Limnocylindria bacterium]